MYKKSQGLSINVIIIVAIALIVLVVLIAIFTGRLGSFVGGVESASTCSNSCGAIGRDGATTDSDKCSGRILQGSYARVGEDEVCCCTAKSDTTTRRPLTARERAAAAAER